MALRTHRTPAVKNIFVVGLDDFHRAQLETLPGAEHYACHPLFTSSEIKQQESFPVAWLLEQGTHILRAFSGHVDAVIGYLDFPVSTTLPSPSFPRGVSARRKAMPSVAQWRFTEPSIPSGAGRRDPRSAATNIPPVFQNRYKPA